MAGELVRGLGLAITIVIAIPLVLFSTQIFAAAVGRRRDVTYIRRPSIAVIMPAHDEEHGIAASLQSVKAQLQAADRLVVVADNCSDRTAEIASAAGAEVVLRHDPDRRGKGFALDYGLRFLAETGSSEIVVIIDADCKVEDGALTRIASLSATTGRPVQAAYLMEPSRNGRLAPVRNLAWQTKNYVRPLGCSVLNLPCQLTGSGMGFPTSLLQSVNLASDEIVEDLALGIELAVRGHAPLFCSDAVVTSEFPAEAASEASQRTRWEHGYLHIMLTKIPLLLRGGFGRGGLNSFGVALDLIVPPLSLLVMLGVLSFALSIVLLLGTNAVAPIVVSFCSLTVFIVAAFVLWLRFGKHLCSVEDLLGIPLYVVVKIPLYFKFLVNRQRTWIRTDRETK